MSRLDEKRFEALGQEWTARLSFNASCAIEDETGESFYAVAAPFLEQLDKQDAAVPAKALEALARRFNRRIRLILFHALAEQHDLTIEDVGPIIEDIGLQKATEIVLFAIAMALGVDAADAEGNAKTRPPMPQANRKARRAAAANG